MYIKILKLFFPGQILLNKSLSDLTKQNAVLLALKLGQSSPKKCD